ncbi:MAG: PQQ-dependent sugar dehydrogenase [Kouleothrix sp.]|jgi:glucose/arabinose dehydrogenase|nr:PQQ-dependent sugar dehydrogenase [Kouleothrix sp.]
MIRTIGLALASVLLISALAPAAAAAPGERCFPETGECLAGRFRQYWEANGGLAVFGFPVGEQRGEQGAEGQFSAQWFERERFEAHPANNPPYDVLLGRLGDEALRRQGRDWQTFPKGRPQPGCQFFAPTGHTVCEPFLSYWRGHGLEFDGRRGTSAAESLALFGYPLAEPAVETNSSGFSVLTQWFERARFEYLPANPDPFKVLLGRLGAELFDGHAGPGPAQYHAVQRPGWPHPLEVPAGFTIDEAAAGLASPRFMALDPADGSLVYGALRTSEVVRLRDLNGDGRFDQAQTIAGGLAAVHSVAFVDGQLYAAAEDRLVRLSNFDANGAARQIDQIIALPSGARDLYGHRTRTVARGPDGKLYLSVGSSCDVCLEDTPLRAALLRMNVDGSGLELYATGLRNTVGFDWRPGTAELWGADMGRNNLGQDRVHDELNRLEAGHNYGWPFCYDDRVPNPEFNDAGKCTNTTSPVFNFPPHWAPLGLVFYNRFGFPAAYQGDALVAFHGTAADQVQTLGGYNVARVRFKHGQPVALEDLVRGWNAQGDVWGRPAGLLIMPDGSLLISDDLGGRFFRLRYVGG